MMGSRKIVVMSIALRCKMLGPNSGPWLISYVAWDRYLINLCLFFYLKMDKIIGSHLYFGALMRINQ